MSNTIALLDLNAKSIHVEAGANEVAENHIKPYTWFVCGLYGRQAWVERWR